MSSIRAPVISRALLTGIVLAGCGQNVPYKKEDVRVPANLYVVQPVSKNNTMHHTPSSLLNNASEELQIGHGNYFSFALPPGWRVAEDGQFALSLVAPDNKAITVMVGNAGLMPGYPPGNFVYEKLMALGPHNLSLSQPVRTQPVHGFQDAYQFQVSYNLPGGHYVGEAVCHIASYYGGCVMAMTVAMAENTQWFSYAGWLPQVSRQIAATNGAAFGMRGVMQQNLQNSIAFGETMRAYREWSQQKWQQVTDDRNRSVDRRHYQFRENLGAITTYYNPYNNNMPLELTTQYRYYWIDRQGMVLGTDDSSVNPNHGSTSEWQQLKRKENP